MYLGGGKNDEKSPRTSCGIRASCHVAMTVRCHAWHVYVCVIGNPKHLTHEKDKTGAAKKRKVNESSRERVNLVQLLRKTRIENHRAPGVAF